MSQGGSPPGPPPPEVLAQFAADPLPWANQQRNMLAVCITLTVCCQSSEVIWASAWMTNLNPVLVSSMDMYNRSDVDSLRCREEALVG
jgi:hypothetical protein